VTYSSPTSLSRRRFLAGTALAAPAAVVATGIGSPASAAVVRPRLSTTAPVPVTQTVSPVWSETLRRSYGVCAHPNLTHTGYAYINEWSQAIADVGAGYIRARYYGGSKPTAATIARCRALGLKWLMLLIPEDWSMSLAELQGVLAHIRDNAADVCIGIEGLNEPNTNRDGTAVPADWAAKTVAYQRTIKEFVAATPSMSHVTVVGPSLNLRAKDPYPDFVALADAGLAPYIDMAGSHCYPGGFKPDNRIDARLGWARSAWGVNTWVSETGYTNALNATTGHKPVPLDVSATYGPRSVIDFFSRGCKAARFEIIDDPNPGNNVQEYNFGLLAATGLAPSTWSPKPEYAVMKQFLGSLRDSAPSCTPAQLQLTITAPSTVKWLPVGRSDGTTSLLAYQNLPVYDPVKRVRLTVPPVDVTIADRLGTRVVKVGAELTTIPVA
jgi:hypothetical protein